MKHFIVTTCSILLLACAAPGATVAHYQFNGSGPALIGSAVVDSAGNHDGAVQGGDLVYGNDPLVGNYLSFDLDGTDRVVIPGAAALGFNTDQSYTIEVIFRTTMTSDIGSLISKGADVSNPDSQLWIRYQGNGQLRGLIEGADNTTEDSANSSAATPVNDGQWHRVALVFDGTVSPKKLQIYVDGNLSGSDASVGTLGIIGGGDNDPVIIGEFASLGLNRSFAGDIAAVRLSDTALAPQDFLPVFVTYITDIMPTNKASFLPASTVARFAVKSPTIGVATTNIQVLLNGADVSSQLSFLGTDADRTVTLSALSANQMYRLDMIATDYASNQISETITFNTFGNNLVFLEGEDYNFDGGQFIDNPQLSSVPGPNNYLDRFGQEGIDYHQTNTPVLAQYRIGDQVGTAISQDPLRQEYLDAQVLDPGVADYVARDQANTEWLNYTRTFPAATYRLYARVARGGAVPIVMQLDEVTSGSTTMSQTIALIGSFRGQPTGSTAIYDFIPLTDALGNEIAVALSGVRTLRLTMISGTANLNLNYLVLVPASSTQVPFLASVSPVAGAGNEPNTPPILISIRNADTSVNTGSVQLKLDAATVTPSVTGTSLGADVSHTPSSLSTGWHTVTLVFSDSAATSVTNEWQFHVANPAVRGHWTFNEETVGNFASPNPGAIQDLSGNTRHGTANSAAMPYVTGSFNYGNSPALQFTTGTDRVVVPDSAGNFTFTSSFTFEAVVRTTSSATTAAILAKNGTGDGEGEYWWRLPGAASGTQRIGFNGQLFLGGTNALNDGQWHHLAVVYDQSLNEVRLYADYVQEAAATFNPDRPIGRPTDLHIGSFVGGGSEFDGDIDFIRVSEGALAPAQFVQTTIALQPIVKSLRPADDANNVAPQAMVEAEFQNRDTAVVLSTLKLFIDGVDVTAGATKATEGTVAKISYTPVAALANGPHTATTIFNDDAVPANSWTNSWDFTVVASIPVLGFYQLNEKLAGNTADTTTNAILDVSGNSRHATATGLLPYITGSPDHGNSTALQFTVGGGNLIVPDAAGNFNWPATQSITLEAIVRTVNIGENSVGSIVAKQGTAPGEWWWRINANGRQQFLANNGVNGAKSVNGATVLNDGQWHHLAAVYDATAQQVRVYVDYALDGTAAAVNAAPGNIGNAKDVWIGAFQNLDREYDGELDAVRISALALDPSWFIPIGGLASSVQLINVTAPAGSISFDFITETGRSYTVQTNATLGAIWGDVETIPGDGSLKSVSYPLTGLQNNFRVRTH
jgi:hypothetical protein